MKIEGLKADTAHTFTVLSCPCGSCDLAVDEWGNTLPSGSSCLLRAIIEGDSDKHADEHSIYCPVFRPQMEGAHDPKAELTR